MVLGAETGSDFYNLVCWYDLRWIDLVLRSDGVQDFDFSAMTLKNAAGKSCRWEVIDPSVGGRLSCL